MTAPARFPFSAVVGHDDLRLALLLNAVHPGVGGVLVRGEKGTAKSTAVRALAALLPTLAVVPGCRFGCDPREPDAACPDGPHPAGAAGETRPARLVELPVGATEDRLVGSLDLERALAEGVRAYQPGLLADAHRGVLYVDEVNLLHDHLVDLLLDAAAMGRAHVERDGVSVSHAARFLLVGTMNPEEGELRPQLLDRFGLTVEVRAARDVDTRVEVVRRRLAFEADPEGFAEGWAGVEADTAERIAHAQRRVGSIRLDDRELRRIAGVCAAVEVDGMRADLVIARAAAAHAAWRGADVVAEEDVRVAARLALPHRRRRDPFDEPGIDDQTLEDALRAAAENLDPEPDPPGGGAPDPAAGDPAAPDDGTDGASGGGPAGPRGDDHLADDGRGPEPSGPQPSGPEQSGPGRSGPQGPDADAGDQTDRSGPDPTGSGSAESGPAPVGAPMPTTRPSRLAPGAARRFEVPGVGEGTPGRRSRARTDAGRVVRAAATAPRRAADVHLPATITAAAPHQGARRQAARTEAGGTETGGPDAARIDAARIDAARIDAARRSSVPNPDDRNPSAGGRNPSARDRAAPDAPAHDAAARTSARRGRTGPAIALRPADLRSTVREGREGNLVLFVVDASGSMAARRRMSAVSGAVLALLRDAYRRRDKVGLVSFRGHHAELALPPTSSVPAAQVRLAGLRTGGRTPLAGGLLRARDVLAAERRRDPRRRALVVLLTDGRATVAARPGSDPVADACRAAGLLAADGVRVVVVDCESGAVRLGLAGTVAGAAGAGLVHLDELTADAVTGVVDSAVGRGAVGRGAVGRGAGVRAA